MVGSVRRSRFALAWTVVVGVVLGGCSGNSATPGPINQPPPQLPRPAATAAPPVVYPGATQPPAWPVPRWTPQPAGPGVPSSPAASNAPYPGNNFQDPGVNPFENANRDPFSTFSMDVDTASYAVTRRFLEDGNMPERDSVRLEEFVNSFDYGYQPPASGAFAISVDGAPSPFVNSRSVFLRIGLQAKSVSSGYRAPVALTFVIDTSGSMADGARLETVKNSLGLLVSRLRPDDTIAIVRFSNDASVVLNPTSAGQSQIILNAISTLAPDGSTNAQAGLELGYNLAENMLRPGVTDRVIIASDGVANVGLTDASSLLGRIDNGVKAGIGLISIGVGMGNFNDALLEQLADRGNGFYSYINDQTEADQVFGSQLTGTLDTVAKDARVQVEFNPNAVAAYRLLGYENRAMSDGDFANPSADAGEVGAGHSVTALYEVQPTWGSDTTLGQVTLHWIDPDSGARLALNRDITTSDLARDFYSTSASFRLAATVAAFAEILRQSPYATGYTLADVSREATSLTGFFGDQSAVAEFAHLAQTAAGLQSQPQSDW